MCEMIERDCRASKRVPRWINASPSSLIRDANDRQASTIQANPLFNQRDLSASEPYVPCVSQSKDPKYVPTYARYSAKRVPVQRGFTRQVQQALFNKHTILDYSDVEDKLGEYTPVALSVHRGKEMDTQ